MPNLNSTWLLSRGVQQNRPMLIFFHHNFASLLEPFPSQQNFETIEKSIKFLSTMQSLWKLYQNSKFCILDFKIQALIVTNMPTFGTHLPSLIAKGTSIFVTTPYCQLSTQQTDSFQYKRLNEEYKKIFAYKYQNSTYLMKESSQIDPFMQTIIFRS